jgi:signal peptidase II
VSESSTRPLASSADERPSTTAPPTTRPRWGRIAAVSAIVIAFDQLTKSWAVAALDDGPIDLVGSLRLRLTFNSGASFSMGAGRGGVIGLVGLVVVVFLLRSVARWPGALAPVALGMILGGALGNLADRLFRAGDGFLGGRVVDFVDLQWWPVFNAADVGVVVGAGLLVLASLRQPQ